ncbi:MAG: tetratricopeptide repeat protein [Acidobacteria bacterium]|nr:tetratricopeptide repeat protein [Acidobacteriota bacterium]
MMIWLLSLTLQLAASTEETQPSVNVVRQYDSIHTLLGRYRFTGEPALLSMARKLLESARRQSPEDFGAKKMEAFATLLEGKYDRAVELALPLNRRNPDDVEIYGYLVDSYVKLGRMEEAERQANWMLRLRPQHRESMRRAAELRELVGDADGAVIMLNDMYRLMPESEALERAWVLGKLSHLTLRSNPKRAEQLARKALEIAPKSLEGRRALDQLQPDAPNRKLQVQLAREYLERMRQTTDYGYADRAQKILEKVLAEEPENYEALSVQNQVDLFRHEFAKVAARSKRLAAIRPGDPVNWAMLGDAWMETGEYDRAAGAYQQMVNLSAGLMSWNRIGWHRFITGDLEGAVEMMAKAVRAGRPGHENTAWCLVELGNLYWKSGRLEQAEAAFRSALENFARMHSAHAGLGHVYEAQGKTQQAIASFLKAQAIAPMVEYAGALAELYEGIGKREEARKQWATIDVIARMEAASGQKANRQLALIYADHKRNLEEALEAAEADLTVRKDVYTWDAYAWVLFRQGRLEDAAKASANALRAGTPEPLFFYHAGMIAKAQGDQERAGQLLDRVRALNPYFAKRGFAESAAGTRTGSARHSAAKEAVQ